MASSPFFKHSDGNDQVRRRSSISHRRFSTTQLCLKKIIEIITTHSSVPPYGTISSKKTSSLINLQFESSEVECYVERSRSSTSCRKRGFDIDLNLRLGPALDTDEEEPENRMEDRGFSACSGVGEADGRVCGITVDSSCLAVFGEVSTMEKSSEGECDPKEVGNSSGDASAVETEKDEEREVVEEETREFSEITNLRVQISGTETPERVHEEAEHHVEQSDNEGRKGERVDVYGYDTVEREREAKEVQNRDCKSDGYLGLLLEAARLISGNFEDDEEMELNKPSKNSRFRREAKEKARKTTDCNTENGMDESIQCRSKRNRCWMFEFYEDFEDISPVVRSKRGRNQVLPYRYRDSVLEPLKRISKQRSLRVSAKSKTN